MDLSAGLVLALSRILRLRKIATNVSTDHQGETSRRGRQNVTTQIGAGAATGVAISEAEI